MKILKDTWRFFLLALFFIALYICLFFLGPAKGAEAADVTLKWDANTEPDLAGYKIYYDADSGAPYTGTGSAQGPSPILVPLGSLTNTAMPEYRVNGLPNTNIYFVVTAYDTEALESDYSNEKSSFDAFVGKPPATQDSLEVTNITNYGTVIINQ
jgi:hypothetical protein